MFANTASAAFTSEHRRPDRILCHAIVGHNFNLALVFSLDKDCWSEDGCLRDQQTLKYNLHDPEPFIKKLKSTSMEKSLFSYLMHEAPQLRTCNGGGKPKKLEDSTHGSNTKTMTWVAPVSIRRWRDFDLKTLITMYNNILRHKQGRLEPPTIDPLFMNIWDEGAVESFIYDWNSKVVCQALKETQELRGQQNRLWMVRGCFAQKLGKNFSPDWAAISTIGDRCEMTKLETSILPGDTKISTKWNFSAGLKEGTIEEGSTRWRPEDRPQWFKPLAQIFTYCCRLRARYGYVITDKELLAVRIGPGPDSPRTGGPMSMERAQLSQTELNGILEFAAVQWDHGVQQDVGVMDSSDGAGKSKMSVNLALWWLHLLAEKDRSFQWEYGPLDQEGLSEGADDSGVAVGDERSSEPAMSATGDNSAARESMTTVADEAIFSFDAHRSRISQSPNEETTVLNQDQGIQTTGKRRRETTDQNATKKSKYG